MSVQQTFGNVKQRIFKTNLLSVLLYVCENWNITDKLQQEYCKLGGMNLSQTKSFGNVYKLIKEQKWKRIGHTLRQECCNHTREALD